MNQLLKWSIENTDVSQSDPTSTTDPKASRPSGRPINADALKALFGGPSDAELMKQSMAAILSPDVPLEEKLVAFDNFEQLIEIIDNANNLDSLGLWTPLIGLLAEKAPDLRRMAAWCLGTAVQNNVKGQDRVSDESLQGKCGNITNSPAATGSQRNTNTREACRGGSE